MSAEADPAARRIFRPASPGAFSRAVAGTRLRDVGRRGKQLLLTLESRDGPLGLLSHLGMTGKWVRRRDGEPWPAHSRARLRLEDGAVLHYHDPRLLGRLRLVAGALFQGVPEVAGLGPDPLADGVEPGRLGQGLAGTRRPVKVALLDQGLLAGVGNILASESLFRARLDPRRRASSLSGAEVRRLAAAIEAAVSETIELEDSPEITYVEEAGAQNPFRVYARPGERCPRCRRGRIRRLVQAQRSTFFCPRCQR